MPPFVSRKREASTPPPAPQRSAKKTKRTVDSPAASVEDKKKFLESLPDSEDSSLSDVDSDDFEDALHPHGQEDEEDVEWEDAINEDDPPEAVHRPSSHAAAGEDLELTLGGNEEQAALKNVKKKGPSKIERRIRVLTHCMHVQFLMYHNATRNVWISDKKVHGVLLAQLPPQIKEVIAQWRRDCGDALPATDHDEGTPKSKNKSKGKQKTGKGSRQTQRDWSGNAEQLANGGTNMSRADPTLRMLKYLARYWNKAFHVTAPGLRKHGYKSNKMMKEQVGSFHNGEHDIELHGERISDLEAFRTCAKRREGSRDIGAQLFTALCRALGLEARLIANLQPLGFGWNKLEEASLKKAKVPTEVEQDTSSDEKISDQEIVAASSKKPAEKSTNERLSRRKSSGGTKDAPVDLDDSSELSDCSSEESVIDVTPKRRTVKRYDRDLPFPTYWTEIISPISSKVYPVDSMLLLAAPATNDEHLALFEPRGTRADKAKQMIAYVIGHSPDGSAKDVTTRYLKRHMWPSKTKGMRLPAERIPIHNRKGKVLKYQEYDWFKTVMSSYNRPNHRRTQVDDIEDATDLKPVKMEKKEVKDGEESLQFYKQSAEFVLERFLRREEALVPGAKSVKTFLNGKGDKAKEEPVFRRSDVVACKTEESWHKEGRKPKLDAVPMKHVPIRAVTITRKREIEDMARRNNGVKPMQGLYSKRQTEYIIPPPIQDGVIPKNSYGNVDCFVPSMVPVGAVHVPLRSTARVCKKLGIDYAEAVTGFEFGNKMAVPVIQGVVVAEENRDMLIDAWQVEEQARQVREDEKRLKLVLSTWRKFLMGARILDRIRAEIGDDPEAFQKEAVNPFMRANLPKDDLEEDELEGGFVRDEEEDDDDEGAELEIIDHGSSSKAPIPPIEDEDGDIPMGGGFMTDTPEEATDQVFDNSVQANSTSALSSEEEAPRSPPKSTKKSTSKKTKASNQNKSPKRRSTRSSAVKSKYFDGDGEDDDDSQSSDDEEDDHYEDTIAAEPVKKATKSRAAKASNAKVDAAGKTVKERKTRASKKTTS